MEATCDDFSKEDVFNSIRSKSKTAITKAQLFISPKSTKNINNTNIVIRINDLHKALDDDHSAADSDDVDIWRGNEEQPVLQEDFLQQPAKQEVVSITSDQVVKEADELQETIAKFLERRKLLAKKKNWSEFFAKKKNCSDGPSDDNSS